MTSLELLKAGYSSDIFSVTWLLPVLRSSSVWRDRKATQVLLQRGIVRLVTSGEHCLVSSLGHEEEVEWFADSAESWDTERWADDSV